MMSCNKRYSFLPCSPGATFDWLLDRSPTGDKDPGRVMGRLAGNRNLVGNSRCRNLGVHDHKVDAVILEHWLIEPTKW
jgi:hypothetical protein